jgi:hypothetical protein
LTFDIKKLENLRPEHDEKERLISVEVSNIARIFFKP